MRVLRAVIEKRNLPREHSAQIQKQIDQLPPPKPKDPSDYKRFLEAFKALQIEKATSDLYADAVDMAYDSEKRKKLYRCVQQIKQNSPAMKTLDSMRHLWAKKKRRHNDAAAISQKEPKRAILHIPNDLPCT